MAIENLGEVLLRRRVISRDQLNEAHRIARKRNWDLGNCLLKLGYVDTDDLERIEENSRDLNFLDLSKYHIPAHLLNLIPESVARKNVAIPLHKQGDTLTVAVSDRFDRLVTDELRFVVGCKLETVVASRNSILEAIDRCYGQFEEGKADSAAIDKNIRKNQKPRTSSDDSITKIHSKEKNSTAYQQIMGTSDAVPPRETYHSHDPSLLRVPVSSKVAVLVGLFAICVIVLISYNSTRQDKELSKAVIEAQSLFDNKHFDQADEVLRRAIEDADADATSASAATTSLDKIMEARINYHEDVKAKAKATGRAAADAFIHVIQSELARHSLNTKHCIIEYYIDTDYNCEISTRPLSTEPVFDAQLEISISPKVYTTYGGLFDKPERIYIQGKSPLNRTLFGSCDHEFNWKWDRFHLDRILSTIDALNRKCELQIINSMNDQIDGQKEVSRALRRELFF